MKTKRIQVECKDQKKEDNVNSTNNVNAASTNEVNVVGGKISIKLPDDPNMPELKDIFYSDDDEDVGAKADMNNLDTLMPSVLFQLQEFTKIIQLIKSLDTCTKWVFRNKKDERGIVIKNKARLVTQGYTQEEWIDYDEVFSPVASINVIRLFLAYATFKDFMVYQMDVNSSFLYGKIDEEVYVFNHQDLKIQTSLIEQWFSKGMIDKYYSSIRRDKGDIPVSSSTASTPMKTQKPLLKDKDGEEVDVYMYMSMIGSLMYLTASRPDIMFAVCLWYPKDSPFDLVAYTDSDYAGASLDRKSTTRSYQFLGSRLISW
ncbi:retrovirus-related pol polyprotein from transposon TNT 1-94 [Tanacetum coccineum]